MKKIVSFVTGLSIFAMASSAMAGGPVIIAEEGEPDAIIAAPTSSLSAGVLVPLALLILLGVAAASGSHGDSED